MGSKDERRSENVEQESFITATTAYVQTSHDWEKWTKAEAVEATLRLLCGDIGAAQAFIYAIGLVNLDLYDLPHGLTAEWQEAL